MWGRDSFLGVQPRPTSKGRGPSAPQFWGFASIYAYTRCGRTTKFHAVTHVGEWRVPWGQPRLPPKRAECQRSPILGVLCIYSIIPTLFNAENDQLRRGDTNTYGRGVFVGGQHICVARFVSDSQWLK